MPDLPRAIHFVAKAPMQDSVGFGNAILTAEFAPFGAFVDVAILHQGSSLLGCASSQVDSEKWLSTGGAAPRDIFVGAEGVGVEGIPRLVEDLWALFLGPHAVEPVIAGDEVAAGIADDRHAEFADFFQDILAEAPGVGELGGRIENAFVDGAAEVFEEGAKEVGINWCDNTPCVDEDPSCRGGSRRRSSNLP
jgi:hypothetical protein